jgi:CheY-like chemotaxis protein
LLTAAERGAAITKRLLAFARRGELQAERIEPAILIDEIRDVLAHTLGTTVTIRTVVPSCVPAVTADRGQLDTVLINLAANARDAMPDGGVLTLAAEAETVPADVRHPIGLPPGQYVRLTVADTGIGMDKPTLARATEPFFTTKPREHGTGLGLSMAKGFAEQSGGALDIESEPGHGTSIMLWLPAAEGSMAAAQPAPSRVVKPQAPRRVLIVDDEAIVRDILTISLEDAGLSVLMAESGAAALALLDAGEAVDVLISDLSMPGMNGLVLIQEAQVRCPGLPAILLTGYMGGDDAKLALGGAMTGAFSLLRKPIGAAQVVERIEALLESQARVSDRYRPVPCPPPWPAP